MKKHWYFMLVAILLALFALPAVVAGQSTIINLLAGESRQVICDGRRLVVKRLSDTTVTVTCLPHKQTPTSTPVPPTPTPTPTVDPTPGVYSDTFPEVGPAALGTCPAEIHDKYAAIGPDGNRYRTWHPIVDPETGCVFAHEHGDKPHPNAPAPPFGYISKVNGSLGMIAAHAGYKCFTHYQNGSNGWGFPELDYGGLEMDFTVCVHQGTAGAGRLSVQLHDFWFWADHQGQETLVTVMADTGSGQSLCNGEINGEDEPGRFIVGQDCHVYEQWIFQANVGNVWHSNQSNFAVTNPVTYLRNGGTLTGELAGNCGTNFDQAVPCSVSEITGGNQFFLGNMRTIHEPDWEWANANGPDTFCTDARGHIARCGPFTVQQRVASVDLSNASARILDRTANSQGFGQNQDVLWSVGVPGGN